MKMKNNKYRGANLNTKLSIRQYITLYNNNKIKLDLFFQRQACWKEKSKISFIEGLLRGDFPGAILLAKIPNQQKDKYEVYFDLLQKMGYQYVSLDGNNRTVAIAEFLEDKYPVRPTELAAPTYYSDLNDEDKKMFDKTILLVEYTGISQADCSTIFINHNESEKLRHQEYRNAHLYDISSYVRNLEVKYRNQIKIFDPQNKYRANDEFILDLLCYQEDPNLCTNKTRRDFIWKQNNDDLYFDQDYLETTLKLLPKFLNRVNYGRKSSKAVVRDFAIIRGLLRNKGYQEIAKHSVDTFLSSVANARNELHLSKSYFTLPDTEGTKMNYSMIAQRPIDKYAFKVRVEQLSSLLDGVLSSGSIKFVTPRTKSTQRVEVRHQLWKNQNMVCNITKKPIVDFLDGKLWHVDHIVPLAKGGEDSIENMQLICAKANLTKGAA